MPLDACSVRSPVGWARNRFGRGGRFGRAAGNPFPVFGFLATPAALPCTENPLVDGSILPLATTLNPLILMPILGWWAQNRVPPGDTIGLLVRHPKV